MQRRPINDRGVASLEAKPGKQYTVANLGVSGLSISVSHGGTKTFYFRYSAPISGKRSRIKIGTYPEWSLAKAREEARALRVSVDRQNDPRQELMAKKRKATTRNIKTVGDIWSKYFSEIETVKKSSEFELSLWRSHLKKPFGKLDIESFTRDRLLDFIKPFRIELAGSPCLVNRTQALITRVANYAVEERIIPTSPAFKLGKKLTETSRKRTLDEVELKRFLEIVQSDHALKAAKVSQLMGQLLHVCLLTASRRSEVAGAEWREFDLDNKVWMIPSDRVKNGREHVVPLSDQMFALLTNIRELSVVESPFVFPSPRTQTRIRGDSVTQACRRLSNFMNGEPFGTHDLRRTAVTTMTSAPLSIDRFIVSKVINHTSYKDGTSSSFGVYDRNLYLEEKRVALSDYANWLGKL